MFEHSEYGQAELVTEHDSIQFTNANFMKESRKLSHKQVSFIKSSCNQGNSVLIETKDVGKFALFMHQRPCC